MHTHRLFAAALLLALGIGLFLPSICRAQMYHIAFDTAGLVGAAGGPFSLDWQLTDGSGTGDGNTTVTISGFTGAALGGSPTTTGGVGGTLPGTVTMTDSAFLSEYSQTFTPGGVLQWDLALNMTVPEVGPTPDEWTLALLDATGSEIPTTAANNAFLTIDLTPSGPSIQTAGTPPGAPIVIGPPIVNTPQAAVPEPGPWVLLLGVGTAGAGLLLRWLKPALASFRKPEPAWWVPPPFCGLSRSLQGGGQGVGGFVPQSLPTPGPLGSFGKNRSRIFGP